MTNCEKYKDQIIELIAKGNRIGLLNDKIVNCDSIHCDHCGFNEIGNCYNARRDWLNAEYIEKLKLTQREWYLCKALKTRYLARGENGALYMYEKKPRKSGGMWFSPGVIVSVENIMPGSFSFIKWQDEEPWSIEDLLKLGVEE